MTKDMTEARPASNGFEGRALSLLRPIEPPESLQRLVLERASVELRASRASLDDSSEGTARTVPERLPLAECFVYAAGISFWVVEVAHALVRLVARASGS